MNFLRTFARTALEDETSMVHAYYTTLLIVATVVSVIAAAIESIPMFTTHVVFLYAEWVTAALFTIEYGLRVWIAKRRSTYVLSYLGLSDLASILPQFLGLGNFAFLKTARIVRVTRAMRTIGKLNASHLWKQRTIFILILSVLAGATVFVFLNGPGSPLGTLRLLVGLQPAPAALNLTHALFLVAGKSLLLLGFGFLLSYAIEPRSQEILTI